MALSVEEWNTLVNEAISAPEDNAKVMSVLTQARDAYTDLFAEKTASDETARKATEENEKLRQTNMDLFLRIGQETANKTGGEPKQEKDDRATTITIDDLFKEDDK